MADEQRAVERYRKALMTAAGEALAYGVDPDKVRDELTDLADRLDIRT